MQHCNLQNYYRAQSRQENIIIFHLHDINTKHAYYAFLTLLHHYRFTKQFVLIARTLHFKQESKFYERRALLAVTSD